MGCLQGKEELHIHSTLVMWRIPWYSSLSQSMPNLFVSLLQGSIFESFLKCSLVPQIHTDVFFSETAFTPVEKLPFGHNGIVKSFWNCQMRKGKGESPITEITFMRVSQDRHLTPLHHMVLLCNALKIQKRKAGGSQRAGEDTSHWRAGPCGP